MTAGEFILHMFPIRLSAPDMEGRKQMQRILMIEDDSSIVKSLGDFLRGEGFLADARLRAEGGSGAFGNVRL